MKEHREGDVMEEEKELWPGAGLWLDFAHIELRIFDLMGAIDVHLEPMTAPARVTWLERFLIEYPDIVSAAALSRADELIGLDEMWIYIRANLIRSFEDDIRRRLKKEQALSDLQASRESAPVEEIEDDPTTAGQVMAVYYLLQAADV